MPKEDNPDQLPLFTDLSPSITLPTTDEKASNLHFDEQVRRISNLNRSMREFRLDQGCQLALTFDENYYKLRTFCSPEEIEERIQKAIYSSPGMRGKLIHISKALRENKSELEKLERLNKKTLNIPVVSIKGFTENFQLETIETGITLELEVSRFSEIAFHISCRFF